ncbi:hypothetical protein FACS1894191_1230 [Clostridia bacterium]|nr:hypothetical protein FACS1894191_1230 [Clostridia bacterium]
MLAYDTLIKIDGAKRVRKGSVILREGDSSGTDMFVLLFGEAGEYRNFGTPGEIQTETHTQGSFFGETPAFAGKPAATTITATSDVILLPLNEGNAADIFARQPELALMIIQTLCKRYDVLSVSYEKLLDLVRNSPAVPITTQPARPAPVVASVSPTAAAIAAAAAKLQKTAPPAAAPPPPAPSPKIPLFPEKHGTYTLPLTNDNEEYLYEQKCTCPLCGAAFQSLTIITSKLRRESPESELRVRYKDVEPVYYDIVTCPKCYFSSTTDGFPEASKRWAPKINTIIDPYRAELSIVKSGREKDTFTVFAGYYITILCAPVSFDNHQLTTAALWQKLSRIYDDLSDSDMYLYATRKALDDYRYAYSNINVSEKATQQICFTIGDLYQRLGEYDEARNFFYMAKTNKGGTGILSRQADLKLDEVKRLMNPAK